MGKKINAASKAPAPQKRAAKPTAKTRSTDASPKVIAEPRSKPVSVKRTRVVAPKKTALPYTKDDVALRAYFIAEKRNAAGLPGDTHQDWVQAERQLIAEAAAVVRKPKGKARASAKKKA